MTDKEHRKEENKSASEPLFRGRGSIAVLSLITTTLIVGLLYIAWQKYGHEVLNDPKYHLTMEKIRITTPPAWIRSNLVSEVMRDGSLDEVSLLDTQASLKIQQAFEMHHWIDSVNRVSKHADGHVEVDLNYRRPVGWVLVENGHLPVDKDGIVLPHRREEIHLKAMRQLPLIDVGKTYPLGLVGTSWGNARVLGAARIAAVFGPTWSQLGLEKTTMQQNSKIRSKITTAVSATSRKKPQRWQYEIITAIGQRIIWGHAPQHEIRGEAAADEKINRLVEYVNTYGPLDSNKPSIQIDLRNQDTIRISQQPNGLERVQ